MIDLRKTEYLTKSQLFERIAKAKRGTRFLWRFRSDMPTVDEEGALTGKHFRDGASTFLRVNRSESLHAASCLMDDLEARGGRINIDVNDKNFWIG